MLALVVAIVGGVFAAVTEFVLHRWFHLYSSNIAGAAWLLFGGYWSLASVRRLRSSAPIAESGADSLVWPGIHILAAYRASFPRVASIAFAVIAFAGVVDRLLRT